MEYHPSGDIPTYNKPARVSHPTDFTYHTISCGDIPTQMWDCRCYMYGQYFFSADPNTWGHIEANKCANDFPSSFLLMDPNGGFLKCGSPKLQIISCCMILMDFPSLHTNQPFLGVSPCMETQTIYIYMQHQPDKSRKAMDFGRASLRLLRAARGIASVNAFFQT